MLLVMIKVGLLATVNNAFAEEESAVIMVTDITMETSYGDLMMVMMMNLARATQKPQGCISRDFHGQ